MFKKLLNTIPRPLLIKLSKLGLPFLDFFYRGNKFTDPINGHSYRRFLPYGYVQLRPDVLSPGTLSLERHRLLWLYLKQKTNFFSAPLKVLHIAPEQAFYKRLKKQTNLNYITADLYSPLADIKADVTNLPFDDHSFDVILCNHVLEHITDDHKAMQELFRVMKPGGWGVLQVPLNNDLKKTFEDDSITDRDERTRIFGQYDHVRVYGQDYFDRLKKAGFKVKAVNFTKELSEAEVKRYRLVSGEIIPVVYK